MFFTQPHKVFFLFSFFFPALVSNAQNKVTIKSGVDKNKIVIGEQIHLTSEADFPVQEPMRFFTIDSIAHFEILERKKIDTVDYREGIKLSQSLHLTSFDSGHWAIPSLELPADKPMYTDSIVVDVGFSPFDPNQDYHDIKDVIDVQVKEKEGRNLVLVCSSQCSIDSRYYLFFGKKKEKTCCQYPVFRSLQSGKAGGWKNWVKENLTSKYYFIQDWLIFSDSIFQEEKGLLQLQKDNR